MSFTELKITPKTALNYYMRFYKLYTAFIDPHPKSNYVLTDKKLVIFEFRGQDSVLHSLAAFISSWRH